MTRPCSNLLSRVRIENFKCIQSVSLNIKPLTIILGPNGSGKSSILQALQLIKQSMDGDLNLNGNIVRLGSFRDNVLNKDEDSWVTIEVGVTPKKEKLDTLREYSLAKLVSKKVPSIHEIGYKLSFRKSEMIQSLLLNAEAIVEVGYFQTGPTSYNSVYRLPKMLRGTQPADPTRILQNGTFQLRQPVKVPLDISEFREFYEAIVQIIRETIESTYYISTSRELRSQETSHDFRPDWVGHDGRNTLALLARIFGSHEHERTKKSVSKWASDFGMPELVAGWRGGQELSADYEDPQLGTTVNVTAAGHGSSQMLPVITQLFWSSEGSTICFEEPEISLHLGMQAKLPHLFMDVINQENQVMLTTHTSNILFALTPLISEKKIPVQKVALYELKKTSGGATESKLELTPEGMVKGGVPSLVEAERNLVYQWITAYHPPGMEEI